MKYLCVFFVFFITSCIHFQTIKVIGFDKEKNTVTFMGEEWDTKEEYQKEADIYCKKKASLIKMIRVAEGTKTTVESDKNNNSTSAKTVPIIRYQYTFKCE
ncbi:hypothetical protein QEJ31_02620 [Pigmentibacter sp. JX0631]|uniref:hypothetical protein n=1 Tax=Pigmentibacter sp. JX0631 TaxID=2976982 RepID=UPI00246838A9|nr:hypothetical protein [Pigmentibacter sp. JX0631]WGL60495.1 hypothetical protein QEJ31_02620 [Pigmentibacter sp. JX0631]